MKLSTSLLLVLPLVVSHVAAASIPGPLYARQNQNNRGGRGGFGFGRGGNNNAGNNNNAGKNTNAGKNNAGAGTAAGANNSTNTNTGAAGANNSTNTNTGATGANNSTNTNTGANNGAANNNTGNANTGNNNSNDPQTSLTLDPRVIAQGFANDGQDVPTAGQVPSLTSTNNFINFCLTVPNLPITDGKQITTGSCNPAPIGTIPSVDNMPSAKFTFPTNGGSVGANTAFTISMAINNLETGNFVNAQENYFAAPQQLNAQGQIVGHSHVVVETLTALDQTTPTDPRKFAFFKGLNAAASGGVLTADVTAGLPAGAYRLCSINTAANHQPAIVPIAQHGSLDDCIYFTAGGAGNANNSTAAAAASTATAANSTATNAATANNAGANGANGAGANTGANAAGANTGANAAGANKNAGATAAGANKNAGATAGANKNAGATTTANAAGANKNAGATTATNAAGANKNTGATTGANAAGANKNAGATTATNAAGANKNTGANAAGAAAKNQQQGGRANRRFALTY